LNIDKLLTDCLIVSEGIILPGFGSFVKKHKDAYIDVQTKVLHPPSAHIEFLEHVTKDDHMFSAFVAERLKISKQEAIAQIQQFVELLKKRLVAGEKVSVEKLGEFTMSGKKISFVYDRTQNYLAGTTNFGDIAIKPIVKSVKPVQKAAEPVKKPLVKKDPVAAKSKIKPVQPKKKTPVWVWFAATLGPAVAIIAVLYFLYPNLLKSEKSGQEIVLAGKQEAQVGEGLAVVSKEDSLNVEEIADAEKTVSDIEEPKTEKLAESIDQKTQKKNALYYTDKNIVYHLIAGSFSSKTNAGNLVKKLQKRGYPAKVIATSNGMFRVSVRSFKSRQEAEKMRDSIRNIDGKKAIWIFEQQTK